MARRSDRELGMTTSVTRRDFVHGLGAAAALAAGGGFGASPPEPADPPARTGLRGSHAGSFEVAHAISWQPRAGASPRAGVPTGEAVYDLAVVGAGLSGLAAAWFYLEAHPGARVLLLDNHDDFGGHAKRNEFRVGNRLLLGHGGSQTLEAPGRYSPVARRLIEAVGVDVGAFEKAFHHGLFRAAGLAAGFHFDAATFGTDATVRAAHPSAAGFLPALAAAPPLQEAVGAFPLAPAGRAQLAALFSGAIAGAADRLSAVDLETTSYRSVLERHLGVSDPGAMTFLDAWTAPLTGLGLDAVPAAAAPYLGLPLANGVRATELSEPYIHHFPDGNASLARLLVRGLIPAAVPGRDMFDVVRAAVHYDALDAPDAPVRLRLDSTVVQVAHDRRGDVRIDYVHGSATHRVTARHCVLACYNMMIPWICPEVPPHQAQALRDLVKVPLVYTNVLLRNWRAWERLGLAAAYSPGRWHSYAYLDFPVSLGAYRYPVTPDEPMVVHMDWEPRGTPGQTAREQHRAGRRRLLETGFAEIEREIRDHLAGLLGAGGFEPGRDIHAITVNRWPHGYAYWPNPLFDDVSAPERLAHVVGRQAIGRGIRIANSDAEGRAYVDAAIDAAWRAVGTLDG